MRRHVPALPFKLKLTGVVGFRSFQAISTSFRVEGVLTLDDEALTIRWGGSVLEQKVGTDGVQEILEVLPEERVIVPVVDLDRAILSGGWWRPRLMLVSESGALAEVPTAEYGVVRLWYARKDRRTAVVMAAAVNAMIEA